MKTSIARGKWAHWFAAAALCGLFGCREKPGSAGTAPVRHSESEAVSSAASLVPKAEDTYPAGRWRLVPFEALQHVVLPISHILIRHRDVGRELEQPDQVSFRFVPWRAPPPNTTRTKEQALQRARSVARRARQDPARFAALAREYSEDPVTRAQGGSLGTVPASDLWLWPNVLDALAATEAGDVTNVVETEFGFHVLRLRPAPEPATVSGQHIVIGHQDAPFLQLVARTDSPIQRTRAEAEQLASRLYEEARAAPERFTQLVERYSDHEDVARGGDFGTWSTREPSPFAREMETLAQLSIGEVAPPLDTLYGLQIVMRTPNQPRAVYAMEEIQFSFDPALPDEHPQSRVSILREAERIAAAVVRHPDRFAEYQRQHCCAGAKPMRWLEGRDTPQVAAVLARLRPGEIAEKPVRSGHRYFVVRRAPLDTLSAASEIRFTLPAPATLDVESVIGSLSTDSIASELERANERARQHLDLSEETAVRLLEAGRFPRQLEGEQPRVARIRHFRELNTRVRSVLGEVKFARYQTILREQFEEAIMQSATPF